MKFLALAVVLVCCLDLVKSDCPPTWVAFPLSQVKGLIQQNPNIKTEAACKTACEKSSTCRSIDWNFKSTLCFHGTVSNPPTKIPDTGVNHWDLSRECPVTTPKPPPPPPPPTTKPPPPPPPPTTKPPPPPPPPTTKPPPPPPPPTTTVPPPPTTTVFTIPPLPLKVCKVDIVFCVDNSRSIKWDSPNNWGLQVKFMQDLVKRFKTGPTDAQFAVVGFGDNGWLEFDFNKYKTEAAVVSAIGALRYRYQGTIMSPGLTLSRDVAKSTTNGARPGVLKLVVLITDGEPNAPDVPKVPAAIKSVKDANIVLVTVGVGKGVDKTFMANAASTPKHFVYAESFNSLSTILDLIIREKQCKGVV